jgi:hypothetical protein
LLHLLGLLAGGVEVVLQALDAVAQRVSSDALPVSALLCPVRPAPLGHHCLFQQVGTLTLTVRPSLGHPTIDIGCIGAPFSAIRPLFGPVLPDSRGHPLRPAARSAARSLHFVRANPSVAHSGDCSAERARGCTAASSGTCTNVRPSLPGCVRQPSRCARILIASADRPNRAPACV